MARSRADILRAMSNLKGAVRPLDPLMSTGTILQSTDKIVSVRAPHDLYAPPRYGDTQLQRLRATHHHVRYRKSVFIMSYRLDKRTVARLLAGMKDGDRLIRSERYFGNIYRSFELPVELDESACEAKHNDGVLELKLVKRPRWWGRSSRSSDQQHTERLASSACWRTHDVPYPGNG